MKHFALLLVLLVPLIACRSSQEKAKQQLDAQHDREAKQQIAELRFRYNAVDDWSRQLDGEILTIDAQPVFVRSDHRPILFFAILDDVRLENGITSVYFSTIPTQGEPWMRVILDCEGCNLPGLKGAAKSMDDIAVVAQITSAVKAIDQGEDDPDYVLHGRLVDFRLVGDYAMKKLEESQPKQPTPSE